MPKFSIQEIATILAALRYFQSNVDDILILELPHFDDEVPLSSDQIDDLCERVNLDLSAPIETEIDRVFLLWFHPPVEPFDRISDTNDPYIENTFRTLSGAKSHVMEEFEEDGDGKFIGDWQQHAEVDSEILRSSNDRGWIFVCPKRTEEATAYGYYRIEEFPI